MFTGGHVNPAITMAEMVKTNGMPLRQGLVYMSSQLVGATLAAFVITIVSSGCMELL